MGNPRRNDVFPATSLANYRDYRALHSLYRQTPYREAVRAIETCGCMGRRVSPLSIVCRMVKAVHVNVHVRGYADKPEAIVDWLTLA